MKDSREHHMRDLSVYVIVMFCTHGMKFGLKGACLSQTKGEQQCSSNNYC